MFAVRLTILLILAALLGGCSDGTSDSAAPESNEGSQTDRLPDDIPAPSTPQEVGDSGIIKGNPLSDEAEARLFPAGKSGPTLRAFQDDGPIALEVEGVPVPRKTIERYVAAWKQREPGTSIKTLTRKAIEEGVIPLAAMYARHRADVGILSERAWQTWKRLEAGEQWSAVVKSSDDPNSRYTQGNQGMRRRLAIPGLAPLHIEEESDAFKRAEEAHGKPYATPLGIMITKASKGTQLGGQSAAEVQREVYRMLFAWDADYRRLLQSFHAGLSEAEKEVFQRKLKAHKEQLKRAMKAARVKVLDESFRGAIYGYRLK